MTLPRKQPKHAKKLIENLLDSLATAVVVLDDELRLAMVNSAAEGLLHVSASSVVGSPLTDLVLKAEDLVASLQHAMDETQPFTARNVGLQLPENTVEEVDLTVSNLESPWGCCWNFTLPAASTQSAKAVSAKNSKSQRAASSKVWPMK